MWWVVIAVVVLVVVLALLRLLPRRPARRGRRPRVTLGGLLPAATTVIARGSGSYGGQHRGTHGARRGRSSLGTHAGHSSLGRPGGRFSGQRGFR